MDWDRLTWSTSGFENGSSHVAYLVLHPTIVRFLCHDLSNDTLLERGQGWEAFVGRGPSSGLSCVIRRRTGASCSGSCVFGWRMPFETIVTCQKQVVGQNRVFHV
jgi:hypothetical protein